MSLIEYNLEDYTKKDFELLKEIIKELLKERDLLLGQLVINDGESATVQISLSQFDEYNSLKEDNKALKSKCNLLQMTINKECELCKNNNLCEMHEKLKQENEAYKTSIIANHDGKIGKRLAETLDALENIEKVATKHHTSYYNRLIEIVAIVGKELEK